MLQQSKAQGGWGVAFPNIWRYYQAAVLENLMQWWNSAIQDLWELEQQNIELPLSEWCLATSKGSPQINSIKLIFGYLIGNLEKVSPLLDSFLRLPLEPFIPKYPQTGQL